LGFRLAKSVALLALTPASAHSLPALGLASQALICRRQRRKQPGRYVTFWQEINVMNHSKIQKNMIFLISQKIPYGIL